MAEINKEYLDELFKYDPATGQLVRNSSRSHVTVGSLAGYISKDGYRMVGIDAKYYLAHRLIWIITYGKPPNGFIDHINGNRLDNRIENLRDVSRNQNAMNRAIHKNNKSGFKGVSPRRGKFTATIRINGKNKFLGDFETPEMASKAYTESAKIVHGEYFRNV